MSVAEWQLGQLRQQLAAGFTISDYWSRGDAVVFVLGGLEMPWAVAVRHSPQLLHFMTSEEFLLAQRQECRVTAALLDIIRFSSPSTAFQYDLIVRYQCIIRQAMSTRCHLIPIGDGTVFVWEGDNTGVMPCLVNIYRAIEDYNNSFEETILWRMGVHVGAAFRFRDINGCINYVGEGLNLAQRVSATVDDQALLEGRFARQIHFSEAAYLALGPDLYGDCDGPFPGQVKETSFNYFTFDPYAMSAAREGSSLRP
jgi:hypothetical protein